MKKYINSIGMVFVYIPPGSFIMGSPSNESGRDDDERQHRVTLTKGFYMQTTEVTQEQWFKIMGTMPSHFKGRNKPVEDVSWNDAQKFIKKLNDKENTTAYRLPTEAEWEYACRAGGSTRFCFGDSYSGLDSYAWYNDNAGDKTHTVGQKQPNAWGLYDMHGNVWEWCQDRYDTNYSSGSVTDPTGPSSSWYRVARGGSWNSGARYCRSAYRFKYDPGHRLNSLGFRLVCLSGR